MKELVGKQIKFYLDNNFLCDSPKDNAIKYLIGKAIRFEDDRFGGKLIIGFKSTTRKAYANLVPSIQFPYEYRLSNSDFSQSCEVL
jgi:hypothetical protein